MQGEVREVFKTALEETKRIQDEIKMKTITKAACKGIASDEIVLHIGTKTNSSDSGDSVN